MPRGSSHHSSEGFWSALRGVLLSPRRFFRNLDPAGGTVGPAVFAALVVYLALLFEAILQSIWIWEFDSGILYSLLLGLIVAVVLGPLLVASLTALVLVILDGAPSRAKFGPLFRALGYASGVLIIAPIPYAPFLILLYGPYVATVAVKETLELSWKRAALGTLIPIATLLLILLALLGPDSAYEVLTNPPQS